MKKDMIKNKSLNCVVHLHSEDAKRQVSQNLLI